MATVAAEVTAKVVDVPITEGMVVKKGDVLAQLDSVLPERDLALARTRADAAEAAIAATAANLADAERIMNRNLRLQVGVSVTEADLTASQAKAGMLRAQLKQNQAQFETAKEDVRHAAEVVDQYTIHAPFGGVIVARDAQPGEMISPLSVGGFTRTGICTLVDMDSIEVDVDVNKSFIGRVHPGMPVSVALDAYPDWTIPASVIGVVPQANRDKGTVKVRIRINKKDPRILPDMSAKVSFKTPARLAAPRPKKLLPGTDPEPEKCMSTDTAMARLVGLSKCFVKGKEAIAVFDRLRPCHPSGRLCRGDGAIGVREDDAAQSAGRDRPADLGRSMSPARAIDRLSRASSPLAGGATSASSSSSTT